MRMAVPADERTMISERVAPGMLPRVLNSFDMTIIFVRSEERRVGKECRL